MRFFRPLIVFGAIVFAGLGLDRELDAHRTAVRAPASEDSAPKERAKTTANPAAPTETVAANALPAGDSLWPNPGERWIYRFERKASAEFGGKPWLKLALGGRAAVEAAESAHGDTRFYLLSVEVDRLEMQGQARNELRSFPGVRMEVDAAGKLRELRFASAREGARVPTEEEADLLRDLASQWLFFEPRSRLGTAEIEWSSDGAAGPVAKNRTVSKHVVRYAGRPEITKLDSNHEWAAALDPRTGARVGRIEGVENFTIPSASGDFTQSTSYRWLWTSTEKTASAPADLALGAAFAIDDVPSASANAAPKKADPAAIARDWPRLRALAPHDRLRLFRDAKRALDDGANELVSLIVRDLRGKSSTSIEWRTGVGALAASSNPAAAAALLALYREPGRTVDEKLSILAGVAAGEGAPAPDWKPAFESALEAAPANGAEASSGAAPLDATTVANFDPGRTFDPEAAVREASLYALGSSIRKETDANRRAGLESVLWSEVKEAASDAAKVTVLEAIGNSGSGSYYPYVKEQFAAGSAPVRAKAVAAVRFLASDLAKPILDRAKSDPADVVRKVAAWSEKFQSAAAPDSAE